MGLGDAQDNCEHARVNKKARGARDLLRLLAGVGVVVGCLRRQANTATWGSTGCSVVVRRCARGLLSVSNNPEGKGRTELT